MWSISKQKPLNINLNWFYKSNQCNIMIHIYQLIFDNILSKPVQY